MRGYAVHSIAPGAQGASGSEVERNPTGPGAPILSIQYLRGLAALMIVLFHAHLQLERLGYAGDWPADALWTGIDLFFVISGVVMWHSTSLDQLGMKAFYARRLIRIVPLYWIMTSVLLAMMLVGAHRFDATPRPTGFVIASYLFVPAVNPVTGALQPLLIPGWTLNAELFFYALFGLCLLLPVRWRLPAAWFGLLAPVVLAVLMPHPAPALRFYAAPVMLVFAVGLTLGRTLPQWRQTPPRLAGAAVLSGALLLAVSGDHVPHVLVAGVPAAMIVGGLVAIEAAGMLPHWRWPARLGDASYSLYLSHGMTLAIVGRFLGAVGVTATNTPAMVAVTLLLTVTSIIVGTAVFVLVERPLLTAMKDLAFQRSRTGLSRSDRRRPDQMGGVVGLPPISGRKQSPHHAAADSD